MKYLKKTLIWSAITLFFTTGFRFFPGGNHWDIDNSSATNRKIFVKYSDGSRSIKNDFPSGESLASNTSLTLANVMDAIMADYNNVGGAFVTLVPSSDSDFAARGTNRTIELVVGSPPGTAAGFAKQQSDGSGVTGCTITIKDSIYDSAKDFTSIITHEMGHCMGLDHAQDTVNAIMSYYHSPDVYRLMIDDKMGLVYLYPTDEEKAKEEQTLGLACSRR